LFIGPASVSGCPCVSAFATEKYDARAPVSTAGPLSIRHFSDRFVVRVPPDVHRRLQIEAAEAGVSLNRLASSKLN
jgi:predicted HicB family RNase H-like nuclease